MRSRIAFVLALAAALSLGVGSVTAHEEEEIIVEPATVNAGDSVILAGTRLEPNQDRVIVLAGQDLIVEFGKVTTDGEGRFQAELTIPSHLPPGTYEFRAIGDETLTVSLAILEATALPASPPSQASPAPVISPGASVEPMASMAPATPAPIDPTKTVIPRERTPVDLALIGVFIALTTAVGGALVLRAERFRGMPRP